jgi:hypothetical protein
LLPPLLLLLLQAVLKTALSRLMREHPFHTLYSLIALKNGDVDGDQQVSKSSNWFDQGAINRDRACACDS